MNTGWGNFANKQMKVATLARTFKTGGWRLMETVKPGTGNVIGCRHSVVALLKLECFWCFPENSYLKACLD